MSDCPAEVRAEMQRWGLPKDEFAGSGHFPHQLNVREARRMVGDYVITENERAAPVWRRTQSRSAPTPLDSHGVTLSEALGLIVVPHSYIWELGETMDAFAEELWE